MKTIKIVVLAIFGFCSTIVTAADLYVRDSGAGGSFSTISAAIAQASNGDRIIIRPKAAGLPFIENLVIDKSLTFVSEINFSNYFIQGTVSVTPLAGRVVTVHNMNLTSTFSSSADSTNGRTTINIYNSSLSSGVNANKLNTSVNISGCSITGTISCTHGRITGNTAGSVSISTSLADTNLATDDIEIIANALLTTEAAIYLDQKNYRTRILNNYLSNGTLYIEAAKTGSNNEIRNNAIDSGSDSAIVISLATGNQATFSVLNNAISTSISSSTYNEVVNSNILNATVYVMYNASTSAFTALNSNATNNISSASLSFNDVTRTVTGTALVNAGAADDDFTDIDLTRNDIGNRGGSDTWENYWPTSPGNKPLVNYLLTPRRIYNGTTEMNATGSGYTK
ncbi:hypothetical protein [Flavobacterium sp. 102]|uniref:hypothetical protein n=1 Tax=Flavobacterium sp. 102 TaxID=2135623 RepID=UPI000EACA6E4|nr:hypothetical protein [Flavobacterium sp. 102]RKS01351.1 hypothetical protein C8C84_1002 [Flavobacterium sp. 102]